MSGNHKIEVKEVRLIEGNKALRAFVDISLDGILIREWRVVKQDGKRYWVSPPQISWKGTEGQIQYKTLITTPDDIKGEIQRIVLNSFVAEMEKKENVEERK